MPNERIRVPNVYDFAELHYDYEIDFAIYAGSTTEPVKIAIECDGIRSHRRRHNNRDRRKDVNLQAAGWIVMRFGSDEILAEIKELGEDDYFVSRISQLVEHVVSSKSNAITAQSYVDPSLRSQLTGYTWRSRTCGECGFTQLDRVELSESCRKCGDGKGSRRK